MYNEPSFVQVVIDFLYLKYVLYALVAYFLIRSIVIITPGKRARIVETFGKPRRKARMPGLSFKLPWPIMQVVGTVDLQIRQITHKVSVKTKDNAFVELPVAIQYQAMANAEAAVLAFYELKNPQEQIVVYVLNNVRQTASGMDMDELYANRNKMAEEVETHLAEQFAAYGFKIVSVMVDEPQPSEEVQKAFNRVIASQQLKSAASNEAEAQRIKLVGIAKAEAESKKLQGQGMADMRNAIAEGLEKSIETMKKAGIDSEAAIRLLMDTNRLDTISTAAGHGNMVLVDMQAPNPIASVAAGLHAVPGAPKGTSKAA